jgi:hypothetical protein
MEAAWVRVPLDLQRPARKSLQWRALTLSEYRVSANAELLHVLGDVRALQAHSGLDMPLLVDEKVHYAISRLLYSQPFGELDGAAWLRRVPMLYGVWHPYKQTLSLVYRAFFPVFALLEFTGCPALGSPIRMQRKVLYMEKVCAALLLAGQSLRADVDRVLAAPPANAAIRVQITSTDPVPMRTPPPSPYSMLSTFDCTRHYFTVESKSHRLAPVRLSSLPTRFFYS